MKKSQHIGAIIEKLFKKFLIYYNGIKYYIKKWNLIK